MKSLSFVLALVALLVTAMAFPANARERARGQACGPNACTGAACAVDACPVVPEIKITGVPPVCNAAPEAVEQKTRIVVRIRERVARLGACVAHACRRIASVRLRACAPAACAAVGEAERTRREPLRDLGHRLRSRHCCG